MKYGDICEESVVDEPAPGLDSQYAVIHCTGFLRVIKQIEIYGTKKDRLRLVLFHIL